MGERKTGRPQWTETAPRAYIRWIKGRAYAELGAWAPWGGRRQEPLVEQGEKAATKDPNTAAILFGVRLAELRKARERAPLLDGSGPEVPTALGEFIGFHLAAKANVQGRRRPSETQISLLESRLLHAARFLRAQGVRDVRQIEPRHVEAYMEHLRDVRPNHHPSLGRRRDALSTATQRKYLSALGNLLQRAKGKGLVTTNVVEDMVDKPTAGAARRLFPLHAPGWPIYPRARSDDTVQANARSVRLDQGAVARATPTDSTSSWP